MTTQVLKARRGIVTEEMEVVAEMEGKTPEYVRERVANGRIVIPRNNIKREFRYCGIGEGMSVKVNALFGTSTDREDKWKRVNSKSPRRRGATASWI